MPPLTNHMHEELASLTPILLVLFLFSKVFSLLYEKLIRTGDKNQKMVDQKESYLLTPL